MNNSLRSPVQIRLSYRGSILIRPGHQPREQFQKNLKNYIHGIMIIMLRPLCFLIDASFGIDDQAKDDAPCKQAEPCVEPQI